MIPKTKAAIEEAARPAGERAYKKEKDAGNILDVNSAVAFKLGWEHALQEVIEHPERYGLQKKITPVINTVPGCDFEDFHSKYSDTDE